LRHNLILTATVIVLFFFLSKSRICYGRFQGALITSMGQKPVIDYLPAWGGQTRRIFVLHQKQRLAAGMGRGDGGFDCFLCTHTRRHGKLFPGHGFFPLSFLSSFLFLSMDAFPFQFFASLDFDVVSQTALGPVVFGQDCYWQE
jgi:hypothetical protein